MAIRNLIALFFRFLGVLVIVVGVYDMFIRDLLWHGAIAASSQDFVARIVGMIFYTVVAYVLFVVGRRIEG